MDSESRRRLVIGLGLAPLVWSARPVSAQGRPDRVHFLVPAGPGGGWDETARGIAEALTGARLVNRVSFEHLTGDGGGRAIDYLIATGDRQHETLMVSSTPIVIRSVRGQVRRSFRDLTPVAAVIGDYCAVVVRADSRFTRFDQLASVVRADVTSLRVGGGSVRGGLDHLIAAEIFMAVGADPSRVNYLPFDAGGDAMEALLGNRIAVLCTGLGEAIGPARSGRARILGITAADRSPEAPDLPTFRELGHDVTFVNWRGLFGSPQMPMATADAYADLLGRMQRTAEWEAVRRRYAWISIFHPRDAFREFLVGEERRVRAMLGHLGIGTTL